MVQVVRTLPMRERDATIELQAERVANLFDPFDPFPIPTRDLAPSAEEFIVGWARELPRDAPITILVHLADDDECALGGPALANAIPNHFNQRAERTTGDLHELFRLGRLSLLIGLGTLAVCLAGGQLAEAMLSGNPLAAFFAEGLIILGWVANWRPLEIFLYDWWPLVLRRRLYRRLAIARIETRPLA